MGFIAAFLLTHPLKILGSVVIISLMIFRKKLKVGLAIIRSYRRKGMSSSISL